MNYLRLRDASAISPKIAPYCLLLVAVVTLLFGLWPLNFHPENQVHWLEDRNGVQFHRQGVSSKTSGWGVIYSAAEMDIPSAGDAFRPATIEIYLESRQEACFGLDYILSFYDGNAPPPLVIAQWKSYLEIQCRDDNEDSREKYRAIDLRDALRKDVRVLLTIASRTDRTDIFVNGRLARSLSIASLFGVEHFRGRLVLGNSPTGENPWVGALYGLALYDECLSPEQIRQDYLYWTGADEAPAKPQLGPIVLYAFDEREGARVYNRVDTENHLTIPRTYRSLNPCILRPFWRDIEFSMGVAVDVIINVLGFIPFGLCMADYLRQGRQLPYAWAFLAATFLGASLSLAIEITQVALPGRYSSSLDLICNTFGASLGAALCRITCVHRKVPCLKRACG